jgi:hypothetical protein
MREGIKVIRIRSSKGELPDWGFDDRRVRRNKAKVRRWERKHKHDSQF